MKVEEKENFIANLWRLSQRFLIQKPDFVNVPGRLLEDVVDPREVNQKSQSVDDLSMAGEDYQALSSKEESDLELLMSECQVAMSNAEVFAEQLSKQLSVLDGNVKEQMEVMQDKDTLVTLRNTNHQRLLEHLQHLVGNELGENLSRFAGEIRMPQHGSAHKELVIYADLMLWLKNTDPAIFGGLSKVYTESLSRLYVLEKVLSELERVCIAEQDFCFRFFHLIDKTVVANPEQTAKGLLVTVVMCNRRQINDEVRFTMYMLVRMSQHVINNQHQGSFLGKTFGNCLIKVKRGFDKCVEAMIQNVKDVKVSKKNRCGIISFVHQFEEFTNMAEVIFKGSDRRTDLNKAYAKLVHVLFEQIQRVAMEHQKTPREVVLMAILSHLKNAGLEDARKEAKQRYTENMQAYTTNLLGRPLEKLHIFFEGVEARVAAGVKREEVGFQLAFSKQELRKVIKEYPGKEVKKTLEHLYKKVEKQLCEEENLLQVVWHEMQDVFINQYKRYDDLMKKCYPDSQLALEFTIDNVLHAH
nr:hypothetical protein BaRGS_004574 [Batillaria attramentaria]